MIPKQLYLSACRFRGPAPEATRSHSSTPTFASSPLFPSSRLALLSPATTSGARPRRMADAYSGSADETVRPCTVSWAAQLLQQFQTPPRDPIQLAQPPGAHVVGFSNVAQCPVASPAAPVDSAGLWTDAHFPSPASHLFPDHSPGAQALPHRAFHFNTSSTVNSFPAAPFSLSCAPLLAAYNESLDFAYASSPIQASPLTTWQA